MKCYENFSMFQIEQTPQGNECLPDEVKQISEKNSKSSNLDIILSKYFNNGELTDIQLQQLNQHDKIIVEQVKAKVENKTKRPDQYQKLFYKKAFKYAQHTFFKKNKKNKSRRMSQFYHFYFQIIAKKLNIPLINFYHPEKKTKPGLQTGQKSFNSCYIKLILKSRSFKAICEEYHEKFIQDCIKQRNNKICSFASSICSLVEKNKDDIKKSIKFLQSSKCKIPWTNKDIEQAYNRASLQFEDAVQIQDSTPLNTASDEVKMQILQRVKPFEKPGFEVQDIDELSYDQFDNLSLSQKNEQHSNLEITPSFELKLQFDLMKF